MSTLQPDMQNLMDVVPIYEAQSRTPCYAKRTASAVLAFCNWHARHYGRAASVTDLTPDTMTRYFHWLRTTTSASTFNLRRHWLKGFCDWAVMKGYLATNPVEGVLCAKRSTHRRQRIRSG